eukprot:7388029-Karenia_brevis.AAC.1
MQAQQKVIDHLLKESKEGKQRQDELEQAQAKVSQQVQQDVDHRLVEDPAYSRPPNRTIVKLGTQPSTPIDNVRKTCKEWLDPLFPGGSWQVTGPDVGNNWTLHFNTIPTTAASNASKARTSLRVGPRNWRKLFTIGADGRETQLFVNPDTPPKVARVQTATRRLIEILQD